MTRLTRRVLLLAAGLGLALPIAAQDTPRAPIEFRRAETAPAEGLVEAVVVGTRQKVYLHKTAALTGPDIASAKVVDGAEPVIELTLTDAGAKKAARLSEEHTDRPLAVVVDGKVRAAPVIRARLGQTVRVSGPFIEAEAARLVKAIGGR